MGWLSTPRDEWAALSGIERSVSAGIAVACRIERSAMTMANTSSAPMTGETARSSEVGSVRPLDGGRSVRSESGDPDMVKRTAQRRRW